MKLNVANKPETAVCFLREEAETIIPGLKAVVQLCVLVSVLERTSLAFSVCLVL